MALITNSQTFTMNEMSWPYCFRERESGLVKSVWAVFLAIWKAVVSDKVRKGARSKRCTGMQIEKNWKTHSLPCWRIALNYENSDSVTASINILSSCSLAIHQNVSAFVPALFFSGLSILSYHYNHVCSSWSLPGPKQLHRNVENS